MLGMGNFPDFSGKNPVPGKWHSGTQTSNWNLKFDFCEALDLREHMHVVPGAVVGSYCEDFFINSSELCHVLQ